MAREMPGKFATLLDRVADVVERGADVGAQRAGAADDGNRDQRGDQPVLDGGGAGLIIPELLQHEFTPSLFQAPCDAVRGVCASCVSRPCAFGPNAWCIAI